MNKFYSYSKFKQTKSPVFVVDTYEREDQLTAAGQIAVYTEAGTKKEWIDFIEGFKQDGNEPKRIIVLTAPADMEIQTVITNKLNEQKINYYPALTLWENEADPEKLKEAAHDIANRATEEENRIKEREKAEYFKNRGSERVNSFLEYINNKSNSCIETGFLNLDKELEGGLYAGLYILGAVSSLGKTTFLLQMADQVAAAGTDVLYFSLEMSANELIGKSISRLTFLNCQGLKGNAKTVRGIMTANRYAGYTETENQLIFNSIDEYKKEIAGSLYFFEGVGNIGVTQIRETVKQHIALTGKDPLVCIDYLQIIAPEDVRASDKQNMDKAVLELKRLSRDYNLPVFAISSFNRGSYKTDAGMEAFKESGAIEYGSDVLMAMQPQGMKEGETTTTISENNKTVNSCKGSPERDIEIVILKNRNGRTRGRVGFTYYSLFNYLEEDKDEDGFSSVRNNPFEDD